ncbi:MAG: molybdenum cofactor guanylyltransferase [Ruminococcus sp.]|nr:molybdenum cofactor guanylyltransferase [Ruminococcus sp.]
MDGLILAGGKSRRMEGKHKGNLVYQKETFTERLINELQKDAGQIWISYGETIHKEYSGCSIVLDEYSDCGPIGGLHAGLKSCGSELLMVAACDMPFMSVEFFRYLKSEMHSKEKGNSCVYDGVVPVYGGKIHPLAAIYRKKAVCILEEQILKKEYKMMRMLNKMDIIYIDVTGNEKWGHMLENINTVSDYRRIMTEEEAEK